MGDQQKKYYMKCICEKGALIKIIDSGGKYSLFSCNSCGIIQSAPFPSKDDYDKFYDGFLFRIPENVTKVLNSNTLFRKNYYNQIVN